MDNGKSRYGTNPYGAWTWIAGFALSGSLIGLMFVLATGFA